MRYKKLIIGAVIAVALIVGVFIFVKSRTDNDKEPLSEMSVLSFDLDKTSQISIKNSDGEYSFKYENDSWIQTEGNTVDLSRSKLSIVAETMSKLEASKIISETAEKLDAYGLDNPAVITVKLSNGKEYGLKLGKISPTGEGYYVQKVGADKIYLLDATSAEKIRSERNDLKNIYMLDIDNSKDINSFKFTRNGELVFDIVKDESGAWQMNGPINNVKVNGAAVSSMLDYFIRVTAEGFFEETPSEEALKTYGLDNPQFIVEASTAEHSVKMLFGNYFDDEQIYIYAQKAETGQVAAFQTGLVGCLDKNTADILMSTIYEEQIINLDGITFTMNGVTTEIKVLEYDTTTTDKAKYSFNGKEITDDSGNELFSSFFKGLIGIKYDNVDESTMPIGTPEISIVYHRNKNPETVTIDLYADPNDASRLFICRDDVYTKFTMSRTLLEHPDGIQETFRKLSKYMESN